MTTYAPTIDSGLRGRRAGVEANLRGVYIIWYRDVLRYSRDRSRIVASLGQPLLFLVVFGGGLSASLGAGLHAATGQRLLRPLPLSGHHIDGRAVHLHLQRHLDRLGPRVRLPARAARRAGEPGGRRAGQGSRRQHDSDVPGRDPAGAGADPWRIR